MSEKNSIRMSGLGGQGVVTAAHILGAAAYKDNLHVKLSPFFGAEKRLAPAESYVRISTDPIHERGEVLYPNIIMVFHPHVITLGKCYTMPFFDGLQQGGVILINSGAPLHISDEDMDRLEQLGARLFHVPATEIAMEIGGTELSTNIAMLGGLYGICPLTTLRSLEEAILERFSGGKFVASGTTAALDDRVREKYGKITQMIEKNMIMIDRAGKAVVEESNDLRRVSPCIS